MWPNDDLWQRLEAFQLDVEGASLPFGTRLARDNNWSLAFASRVVLEYKKFLYLACTAGHVVTPSDEVDQAWHLHLTYTRSYWDELCAQVLKQPLHHDPTRGGKKEGQKFENWYERTLDSYRAAFGTEPPADIWPPSHIRFGEASHFRRVNLKHHWVLRRPRLPKGSYQASLKIVPAALLLLVLAGCSRSGSLNPFDWYGDEFLALYWPLCAVLLAASLWMRMQGCGPHDEVFPAAPPDPYVLARLADGAHLPLDTALCALQWQGRIEVDTEGRIVPIENTTPPRHPFEQRVLEKIGTGIRLQNLRLWMQSSLESLDGELQNLELLLTQEKRWSLNAIPLGVTAFLLAVALTKIILGLQRERPVGFLIFSCFCLVVFATVMVTKYSPRRTARGERYLAHLRAQTKGQSPNRAEPERNSDVLVMGAALWGYSELENYGFTDLQHQMNRTPTQSANARQGSDGGYYGYGATGGSDSSSSGSSYSGGSSDSGSSDSGGSSGGDSGCGGGGCGGCGGGGGD
jgi:uncharacterized protein (TIGR04222 family)